MPELPEVETVHRVLEPLDGNLTGEYLQAKAGTCKKTIKETLHNQSIVAGVGNIYSDEVLFAARLHPE